MNQFITVLNKAYTINVIPELATYPSLEAEFVKAAKDLLDHGIFQQMVDSKQDTSTIEQLKTYPRQPDDQFPTPLMSLGFTTVRRREIY